MVTKGHQRLSINELKDPFFSLNSFMTEAVIIWKPVFHDNDLRHERVKINKTSGHDGVRCNIIKNKLVSYVNL